MRDQVHEFLALERDPLEAIAGEFQAHVRLHPRQQFLGDEGLGDVVHGARVERAQQQVAILRRGEEDRGHAVHCRDLLQRRQQFEAIHAGHHHVQQDEVRSRFGSQRQRVDAVVGAVDPVTVAFQQGAHHANVRGLVIDDQDLARLEWRMRHARSLHPVPVAAHPIKTR